LTLAEKLNGDLWWRCLNGPLSLFSGVGQSIRVAFLDAAPIYDVTKTSTDIS
jgi:hypothetical protein